MMISFLGQCKTNKLKVGICCFSVKYTTFSIKSKDWLAENDDNVSEYSDISTGGLVSVS